VAAAWWGSFSSLSCTSCTHAETCCHQALTCAPSCCAGTRRVFVRDTAPPLAPTPATAGGSSGGSSNAAMRDSSSSSSGGAPEVVTLGSSDGKCVTDACLPAGVEYTVPLCERSLSQCGCSLLVGNATVVVADMSTCTLPPPPGRPVHILIPKAGGSKPSTVRLG
jgi:hypothetical protein